MHRSFHQSYFPLTWAMLSKLHHLGCESLCYFLSVRRKQVGAGVFLWTASERQSGGFFHGNRHFSKTGGKRTFSQKYLQFLPLGTFSKRIPNQYNISAVIELRSAAPWYIIYYIFSETELLTVNSKWFLLVFRSPSFCSLEISVDIAARSMQR